MPCSSAPPTAPARTCSTPWCARWNAKTAAISIEQGNTPQSQPRFSFAPLRGHGHLMKACIYGAGAIGGWIGAGLAGAGATLSVVARGATLEALQTHGLRIEQGGQQSSVTVQASANPAELGVQDLVLTAMNGVPWWFLQGFGGALAGRQLQSVDPTGEITAAIPPAQVIGCVVHASCSLNGPGHVKHHFGNGLIIGEPAGGSSPRSEALLALLLKAGFQASASAQI